MPGGEDIDQCPFCNALWGECLHIRLLLEWESGALLREAEEEPGTAVDSRDNPQTGGQAPHPDKLDIGSRSGQT